MLNNQSGLFNLVTKYIDSVDKIANHVQYCTNYNFPFIYVNKGDRFSTVDLTVWGTSYSITENGINLIKKRYENEHDFLEFILKPKSTIKDWTTSENQDDCHYEKIPNERIPDFCNRIFDIVSEYNEPVTNERVKLS